MSGAETMKAEVKAVRDLRNAVNRYAEQMRDAMDAARREAAALVKRAEEARERRKARLGGALAELRRSQAVLAACRDERQVAGLRRRVAVAQAEADKAKQEYARGQQAAKIAAAAQSDLAKTVQALEAVVGEHSSVSSSALTTLDERLAEIDVNGSVGKGIMRRITAVGVAAELAMAAASFTSMVGDAAQGHLPTADRFTSNSQQQEEHTRQQQEYYAESDKLWRERRAGEVPQP